MSGPYFIVTERRDDCRGRCDDGPESTLYDRSGRRIASGLRLFEDSVGGNVATVASGEIVLLERATDGESAGLAVTVLDGRGRRLGAARLPPPLGDPERFAARVTRVATNRVLVVWKDDAIHARQYRANASGLVEEPLRWQAAAFQRCDEPCLFAGRHDFGELFGEDSTVNGECGRSWPYAKVLPELPCSESLDCGALDHDSLAYLDACIRAEQGMPLAGRAAEWFGERPWYRREDPDGRPGCWRTDCGFEPSDQARANLLYLDTFRTLCAPAPRNMRAHGVSARARRVILEWFERRWDRDAVLRDRPAPWSANDGLPTETCEIVDWIRTFELTNRSVMIQEPRESGRRTTFILVYERDCAEYDYDYDCELVGGKIITFELDTDDHISTVELGGWGGE